MDNEQLKAELLSALKRKYPSWLPIAAIVVGAAAFSYFLRSSGVAEKATFPLGIIGGLAIGAIVDAAMVRARLNQVIALLLMERRDG
jgi:lipoprotein signal peptidase